MIWDHTNTFGETTALVSLRGQLVLGGGTRKFRQIAQHLVGGRYKYIALDLAAVERIDCAGLAELAKFHTQARKLGTTIALRHLPCRPQGIVVTTRLVTLFGWCESDNRLAA
jgi:anti-anti-sigma regulatory factor